jgi:hypothetical protein
MPRADRLNNTARRSASKSFLNSAFDYPSNLSRKTNIENDYS